MTQLLDRLEQEQAAALELQADVHLVDLSVCSITRGASSLPDLLTADADEAKVDDAFLIPVAALECLARTIEAASFDPDKVQTFEVNIVC